MRNSRRLLQSALALLSVVLISSCGTHKPLVTAVECPQPEPLPAYLMEPPEGLNATEEIERLLQQVLALLESDSSETPTGSTTGSREPKPTPR